MKAFISYSHKDEAMLGKLHTHLSQLKREGQLSSWTDEEIPAGGSVDKAISRNLESAQIFIALLSPDYIASNYCYENEFKWALKAHENGELTIIPIILEPCDWLNTPFKAFKALPKDGKAISIWQNPNTAFLDVIQNVRKFLKGSIISELQTTPISSSAISKIDGPQRNYRVKKDFDSIQKMEFIEKSFEEVSKVLVTYIEELLQVDEHIKCRVTKKESRVFESILVNRNKIGAEATLQLVIASDQQNNASPFRGMGDKAIKYKIIADRSREEKGFGLSFDEFHMFWTEVNNYYNQKQAELSSKEIVDNIWKEWLESVGVL